MALMKNPNTRKGAVDSWNSPFLSLRDAMDKMLDDWSTTGGFGTLTNSDLFQPSLDIKETGNAVKIAAELPGMKEDDIHLELHDDRLVLKGEKKEEREEDEKGYYRKERFFGSFHREIMLPYEVDRDRVEAQFKNGVLKVTLNKSEKAIEGAKKIKIQS